MANAGGILTPRLQLGALCPFPAVGLCLPSSALPAMEKNCSRLARCQQGWFFWAEGGLGPNLQPPLCVLTTEALLWKKPCQHLQQSFGENMALSGCGQSLAEPGRSSLSGNFSPVPAIFESRES